MIEEQLKILDRILGSPYISGNGREMNYICPFPGCSHKRKLAVNKESGKWHCWSCGQHGLKPDYLVRRFGGVSDKSEWDTLFEVSDYSKLEEFLLGDKIRFDFVGDQVRLPKEYVPLYKNASLKVIEARGYLFGRGLTEKDFLRYRIGACYRGKYAGRVIFPSFDKNGQLN